MTISSIYASMAAWFTPTMLFCVMNLIIGTIFIASKTNGDTKPHDQVNRNTFRPIARVSSFLDGARSVNLSSCTTTIATVAESLQLRRSSPMATYSSLSRLAQSIFLSSSHAASPQFSYGDMMSQSESERKPIRRPPSLLERVKSIGVDERFSRSSVMIHLLLLSLLAAERNRPLVSMSDFLRRRRRVACCFPGNE